MEYISQRRLRSMLNTLTMLNTTILSSELERTEHYLTLHIGMILYVLSTVLYILSCINANWETNKAICGRSLFGVHTLKPNT